MTEAAIAEGSANDATVAVVDGTNDPQRFYDAMIVVLENEVERHKARQAAFDDWAGTMEGRIEAKRDAIDASLLTATAELEAAKAGGVDGVRERVAEVAKAVEQRNAVEAAINAAIEAGGDEEAVAHAVRAIAAARPEGA